MPSRSLPGRAEALENLRIEVGEITSELSESLHAISFDQTEAEAIERRLRQISRLKSRYGGSVEEILAHCKKAREELEGMSSQKENLLKVTKAARAQKEKDCFTCQQSDRSAD